MQYISIRDSLAVIFFTILFLSVSSYLNDEVPVPRREVANGEWELFAYHASPRDTVLVERQLSSSFSPSFDTENGTDNAQIFMASIYLRPFPSSNILSNVEEKSILAAYRMALLHGSPWCVLTCNSEEDCQRQIDFLLLSRETPHLLFPSVVVNELQREDLRSSARMWDSFFQSFSSSLKEWLNGRDPLSFSFPLHAEVEEALFQSSADNTWLDIMAALQVHSLARDPASHKISDGWEDGSFVTSYRFNKNARVEEVPRLVVIREQPLILPGILLVRDPDIFYRLDIISDTLVALFAWEKLQLDQSWASIQRPSASSPSHPARSPSSDLTQSVTLHIASEASIFAFPFLFQQSLDKSTKHLLDKMELLSFNTTKQSIETRTLFGMLLSKLKASWKRSISVKQFQIRQSDFKDALTSIASSVKYHLHFVESNQHRFSSQTNFLTWLSHYLASFSTSSTSSPTLFFRVLKKIYAFEEKNDQYFSSLLPWIKKLFL